MKKIKILLWKELKNIFYFFWPLGLGCIGIAFILFAVFYGIKYNKDLNDDMNKIESRFEFDQHIKLLDSSSYCQYNDCMIIIDKETKIKYLYFNDTTKPSLTRLWEKNYK